MKESRSRQQRYTKEYLESLVANSGSMLELMRSLGLKPGGGSSSYLRKCVASLGLDTNHWRGQGWASGKSSSNKLQWQEVLVVRDESSRKEDSFRLRRALVESGRAYECSICRLGPVWQSRELRLQVDHINGKWYDNSPENLRFLCPNCHSQTENWGKRPMAM